MKPNPRLIALAIILFGAGLLLAFAVENPLLRYGVGLSAFAVGLGLLRRAFRVE
jgi:hypothetical protein